ncbi:Hypp9443, partial [Branchiostoma lanceolatum]
ITPVCEAEWYGDTPTVTWDTFTKGRVYARNPSSDPRIFSSAVEPLGAVLDVTTPGVKSGQDDSSHRAVHGNHRPAAGAVRGAERYDVLTDISRTCEN